jgi:peptidoglycan hydrolase-like protein with peptidoglycan-binding domain
MTRNFSNASGVVHRHRRTGGRPDFKGGLRMNPRIRLWITAAALGLAAPVQAADLALLLDAGDGDEAVAFAGDALNAQGYEVFERAGADRAAMREAIETFVDRLDEAARAILLVAGRVHEADGRFWLLPADHAGEGSVDAAFDGVPVDLLLALAADLPGRAAVVVGFDANEDAEAPGGGAAAIAEPPQGVLLLVGPREAALAAVTDRLLSDHDSVAEALAGIEDVAVAGFVSPDMTFGGVQAAAPAPLPEPAPGEGPAPLTPEERAEAAEDALALSQAARRAVQEDLTVLGYGTRGIDGIFGPGTRTAIGEWQERAGDPVTGFLDAEQVARLRAQAADRSAELAAAAEAQRAAEEAADAEFWRTTGAGGTAADLRAYLARYPDGIYAAEARTQLAGLEAEARAAAEAEDRAAWDAAVAADTPDAYRGYLTDRPEGAFAGEAAARLAALEAAPAEEAARAAAQQREEALGLNQASRALIEGQLAAVGHDVGATDGSFDEDSRRAIREFQTRQGLPVTGYVDQALVQALIVASLGLR